MTTARYRYKFQLHDKSLGGFAGPAILTAGGTVIACVAGSPLRATLTDVDGVSVSQPVSLTRGGASFYTTETALDLFIQSGDGQFVALWSVGPDELNEVPIDRYNPDQCLIIPFHITNFAAATETDTGFDQFQTMAMKPWPMIKVTTVDAGQVIDVGTDGSGGNDPDGFIDGVSVANALLVKATLLASGDTMGALLSVLDSANAGDDAPEPYVNSVTENITATLDAGSDTAAGYIFLPYYNFNNGQPTVTP